MSKKILLTNGQNGIVAKFKNVKLQVSSIGVKLISLYICHKLILVVNMPDKIVTLNDILVAVFCK